MGFPQHPQKHLEEALINPRDFVRYKQWKKNDFPKKYLIVYQNSLLSYFKRKFKGTYRTIRFYNKHTIYRSGNLGLIRMNGIGAPHAATLFEELIEVGGKEFVNVGVAGGLYQDGIFLCERAIRDEGTSHHYVTHGKYAYPDAVLTRRLERSLKAASIPFSRGTTWTIDAPYRETKAEVEKYRREGVKTVEMEASALFTVAKVRKVKIASAFVVSDVLGRKWEPRFHKTEVKRTLHRVLDAAIDCLTH
jgi:uridine phosphorylase